jgi:hypothetical protein
MTTATIEQPASHFGSKDNPRTVAKPHTGAPSYAGPTPDLEQKARKDKKAVARPTTTLGWIAPPENDEAFFARIRVLVKAVLASPLAEIEVLTCASRKSATAYAGHFSRIANENLKRGAVVARAFGDKVVATFDPKAKRG